MLPTAEDARQLTGTQNRAIGTATAEQELEANPPRLGGVGVLLADRGE
jgi:hypothetical protein